MTFILPALVITIAGRRAGIELRLNSLSIFFHDGCQLAERANKTPGPDSRYVHEFDCQSDYRGLQPALMIRPFAGAQDPLNGNSCRADT